jgi:hypothetical protein
MSLSVDTTQRASLSHDDPQVQPEPTEKKPKEFDFGGHAYAAIHLPTGLLTPAPTKAQVKEDIKDVAGT